jgi:hypothetical protein
VALQVDQGQTLSTWKVERISDSMSPRKIVSILLASVFAISTAFAANSTPSTLITNVSGRTVINLDGAWRAIVDPYAIGTGMRFYEDAKPKTPSDLVEYHFDESGC